jgi:hypothetical protein
MVSRIMKKAAPYGLPFSLRVTREKGLFVFMTHLLPELPVFVLGDFFPPFLDHTTHSIQPPFDILRGKDLIWMPDQSLNAVDRLYQMLRGYVNLYF